VDTGFPQGNATRQGILERFPIQRNRETLQRMFRRSGCRFADKNMRHSRIQARGMIDLYFWTTPNGYKVTILLEELGLAYNVVPVHIGKGEQLSPEFLKISPNNKIPALVDHDGPDARPIAVVNR